MRSARGISKKIAGPALVASLALVIGVTAGPAAAAPDSVATAAKAKKCKKKGSKAAAKKKGCKKKAQPKPLVRATLTWDTETDFDLWVFDSAGNRARAASNTIANTTFSTNDIDGLGPETFTDRVFRKPGRAFSYGVCFQDGGSNPTTFTLTYVTADGISHTASETLGSDGAFRTYDGGAPIPATQFCRA
jgi:hypothetical protein